MSFQTKVQKVVLEMAEGKNLKQIKEKLVKGIEKELCKPDGVLDRTIMKSLEDWKEKTVKVAVREVMEEIKKEEDKKSDGGK